MQKIVLGLLITILTADPAFAYIGPGLGLGALGAIIGVVFSIFLAVFAIFWYPIKRLIAKLKNGDKTEK